MVSTASPRINGRQKQCISGLKTGLLSTKIQKLLLSGKILFLTLPAEPTGSLGSYPLFSSQVMFP